MSTEWPAGATERVNELLREQLAGDCDTVYIQLHTSRTLDVNVCDTWGQPVRGFPHYTAVQGPAQVISLRDVVSGCESTADAPAVCSECGRPLLPILGAPDTPAAAD